MGADRTMRMNHLMKSRTFNRLGAAGVLAALAVSLFAVPSSAAGTVRVVDNDGRGTAANCDATKKAYKKVQPAINASGPGDIVKVCPGTYAEKLSITGNRAGLQVLSIKPLKATIKDPQISDGYPYPPIVLIKGVNNVTFKGFKVRVLSSDAYLPDSLDGIVADGASNVTVRGNDVGWAGPSGATGKLMNGITAKGGTTGTILGNVIKDAYQDGIFVTGSPTNVTVQGNTLSTAAPGGGGALNGIEVRDGGAAIVKSNTITSALPSPGSQYSKLTTGIKLYNAASSTQILQNSITDPVEGINAVLGSGYKIIGNAPVVGRQMGIVLSNMDNGQVKTNTARGVKSPGHAIWVSELSNGNTISGNTTINTFGFGCIEVDSDNNGINNTWSGNDATSSSPNDLCQDVPG